MVQYLGITPEVIHALEMSCTNNPRMPHVRMEAVKLIRSGWSTRKVARYFGFNQSTIVRWTDRAPSGNWGHIPTRSSRPWFHPHTLAPDFVEKILAYRQERNQCAEILQYRLAADGYHISLSSVKRTLKRNRVTRFSKWKKWHQYPPRPMAEKPGALVEIDTIHCGAPEKRLYIYTLLDVYSRWAYAIPVLRINTHQSLRFVMEAKQKAPFLFQAIQSDHGSEFSKWFTKNVEEGEIFHRHSRVRQPNDNAHLERFNRTIQEECISRIPRSLAVWQKEIPEYLRYYNEERPHMGIDMKTPMEVMRSY